MAYDSPADYKIKLRRRIRQARLELPPADLQDRSERIVSRLEALLTDVELTAIHCYEPMAELREVNILPLIDALRAKQPQLLVYTSRKVDGLWQIVSLEGQLVHGRPRYDAVIVPMLGFDPKTLHRLGNGGGYYDHFLSDQTEARIIGVCFELGKLNRLPGELHDIAMDTVVTEERLYRR